MARLKIILLILLVLAQSSVCLYAQVTLSVQSADSINTLAKAFQKTGNESYMKGEGEQAIRAFIQAYDLYLQNNNTKAGAICLHSIAFAYDELLHDNKQALNYTGKSITIHRDIGDTLGMANMYKYAGMLKGRLGMYAAAKADIDVAISLFRQKEYAPGVAVSMFDLALVYIGEKKPDSAIHYLERAKEYWVAVDNPGRIFNLNNVYMDVLYSAKETMKCRAIINENEEIMGRAKIFFRDKLDFYSKAAKYSFKEPGYNSGRYASLYTQLSDSLNKQGIK